MTLGEGGTLDTYNGKSASQVKDVVEALAKVALTAATILAASPAEIVLRPASAAENTYFQELLNMRARISRRLVELDQKTHEHTLTTEEIDANKEKRKPLEARQKVVVEKSTLAKARLDALQIKLSKSGLSVAELENLKQVDVQSKALEDEKKGLDQKLDALPIKSPVAASKLSAIEMEAASLLGSSRTRSIFNLKIFGTLGSTARSSSPPSASGSSRSTCGAPSGRRAISG